MANIRSLSDLKKEDQSKKQKKDFVSHYTGGQHSGLAVENGGNNAEKQDGAGNKVPDNCRKITLYKNGFILDGGEFRDLSIVENKRFMEDIESGFLPAELVVKGKYVTVALSDNSHITYTPTVEKQESAPYRGAGQKLGGNETADISTEELKKLDSLPQKLVRKDIDMNKPTTDLQIRLYNGRRIEQKLNHDHTVEDLYECIYDVTPVNFTLLYDFPLKAIPKSTLTLEEAKIIDAVIIQKRL